MKELAYETTDKQKKGFLREGVRIMAIKSHKWAKIDEAIPVEPRQSKQMN